MGKEWYGIDEVEMVISGEGEEGVGEYESTDGGVNDEVRISNLERRTESWWSELFRRHVRRERKLRQNRWIRIAASCCARRSFAG